MAVAMHDGRRRAAGAGPTVRAFGETEPLVSHLMLDRLAWVDGRHQAVLVWTTWVALDEPGLRCYQERWRPRVGSETDCMGRG